MSRTRWRRWVCVPTPRCATSWQPSGPTRDAPRMHLNLLPRGPPCTPPTPPSSTSFPAAEEVQTQMCSPRAPARPASCLPFLKLSEGKRISGSMAPPPPSTLVQGQPRTGTPAPAAFRIQTHTWSVRLTLSSCLPTDPGVLEGPVKQALPKCPPHPPSFTFCEKQPITLELTAM